MENYVYFCNIKFKLNILKVTVMIYRIHIAEAVAAEKTQKFLQLNSHTNVKSNKLQHYGTVSL